MSKWPVCAGVVVGYAPDSCGGTTLGALSAVSARETELAD
jgi:hypothetical protein